MNHVWFYDLQTEKFHTPAGMVGSAAICGVRWGHATIAVYETPPEEKQCTKCFKKEKK